MGRLFGTDGVRGIANVELTCERAMEIGRAAATVLSEEGRKPTFLLASDTRTSAEMLGAALVAGLCSVGANVVHLGVLPTPAVAFLVEKYQADAGIMISASHNPAEFNGIKIFSKNGVKLPDMLEERIEEIVLDRTHETERPMGGAVGRLSLAEHAVRDYVEHLTGTIEGDLSGLRIAVDCANGSASVTAPMLFSELGAEVTLLHHTPNGTNINEHCGSTHLEGLSRYVREGGFDVGIAFDGDADRCLAVDERGEVVDGDQMMAICALDRKKRGRLAHNTVVGTIMTNFGFGKFCEANGIVFLATKVGDRYVLEEMLQGGYEFGGEQSGHIIFREFATTGDGQLSALQLLSLLNREKKPLSELSRVMTKYPQTTQNLTVSAEGKIAFYTDGVVAKAIEEASRALGNTGRIVVRPSGTEPMIRVMVEGEDRDTIEKIAGQVSEVLRARLGNK